MGGAVKITRAADSGELRRLARQSQEGGAFVSRLLALAHVLDGLSRTDVARLAGMDRQTLCDWVHRFNASGVEGLRAAPRLGRPARLSAEVYGALLEKVATDPDPETDGVVRWRRVDLKAWLEKKHKISLAETSIGKLLRKGGCRRLSERPRHPEAEPHTQEAFKKLC